VGFSHRRYFDGISVYDRGSFETPLGGLMVDRGLARELMGMDDKFYFNPRDFKDENSVEMLMPFVRHTFAGRDIGIVPIVMGVQSFENSEILGNSLYELLKDRDRYIIIASTDMSHYHNYGEANAIDGIAVDTIKLFDPKAYFNKASMKKCESCGTGAIVSTMIASKRLGADSVEILKYANSGDTTGQKRGVVGYLSAAFYKKGEPEEEAEIKEGDEMLNKEQKDKLLKIARETMEAYVNDRQRLDFSETDPLLNKELGAFVTIHKGGQLRGCIGNIVGKGPLYLTVRDMAIESATADPRFSPVTPSELDDIDVEISVLSELDKVSDPEEIELGRHGVIVKNGFRSGVFLPQVATETGWGKEEFMRILCAQKAGLPPDAWKDPNTDIFIFTAEVFSEKE
jgi:hypothetical protein